MVLNFEKTLKTTIQKNLRKSQKFARKTSVAEFSFSQTILLQFTVIFILILKLMILWNFILKLYLRSWSLLNWSCPHCILISISANFPYSNHKINFSEIFHYFCCESKVPKLKRFNQCMKLDWIICLFITMNLKFFLEL